MEWAEAEVVAWALTRNPAAVLPFALGLWLELALVIPRVRVQLLVSVFVMKVRAVVGVEVTVAVVDNRKEDTSYQGAFRAVQGVRMAIHMAGIGPSVRHMA
jgi:hypothetical protein